MNLLTDPLLTLAGGGKVSLPALFAAMARGEARGFPALRPHQRPAWHMFLVQLGALAIRRAKHTEPPVDTAEWAAMLRGLTREHDDDAPWRLAVEDCSKPAFLQSPAPEGLRWRAAPTPDALDMLITARNHDLKQTVANRAAPEDWAFALVSLQTCEGLLRRRKLRHRAHERRVFQPPDAGSCARSGREYRGRSFRVVGAGRAQVDRRAQEEPHRRGWAKRAVPRCCGSLTGPKESDSTLRDLDPWFIEICRRVRLTETRGALSARRAASKAARIDAKSFKGNVGDPWAPVHKTEGKSFTLGSGDFDYRQLVKLMFSGDWRRPLLAQPGSGETGAMLLIAEAFARGNSKTEGFKSRIVPAPGKVVPIFSSETAATLSQAQIVEIKRFDQALRYALALVAARGERNGRPKTHYAFADPASKQFNRAADRLFFPQSVASGRSRFGERRRQD